MERNLKAPSGKEGLSQKPVYIILDIDRVIFDTERFKKSGRTEFSQYSEEGNILSSLSRLGTLCVFSEVVPNETAALQRRKLSELGIAHFFDESNIHISADKMKRLPEILEKYKGGLVILVDDRVEILEEAKKIAQEKGYPDLFTVWVQRGAHAEDVMSRRRSFNVDAITKNLVALYIMASMEVRREITQPLTV